MYVLDDVETEIPYILSRGEIRKSATSDLSHK